MTLAAGTHLVRYEIRAKIAESGMGKDFYGHTGRTGYSATRSRVAAEHSMVFGSRLRRMCTIVHARAAAVLLSMLGIGICSAFGQGRSPQTASPTPKPTPQAVPFDEMRSAAFGEFAKSGSAYAELHHRHVGVTQPAPDTASCQSWPKVNPGKRTLRLGFVAEEPVHTVDRSGRHLGFEADLAVELVRR